MTAIALDGVGWHGARNLVVPDNILLLPLPPYAPELNPVENVRACLCANKLAITVCDSYDDIVDACCTAWKFFANDPLTITSITSGLASNGLKGETRPSYHSAGPFLEVID